MSALPADPGSIPRRYWPISVTAVVTIGLVYWSIFGILRIHIGDSGHSIGQRIGFEVLYDNENIQIDQQWDPATRNALRDINRRRAGYKVWSLPSTRKLN